MRRLIIISILLTAVLLAQFSFRQTNSPLQEIRALYLGDLQLLEEQAQRFHSLLNESPESDKLQRNFTELRRRYKRVEFMLEYLQSQDVKDHLNGAPLPKTERNAPRLVIIEPKGLQRMEELVYANQIPLQGLRKLSKEFNYQLSQVNRFAQMLPFNDRQVFEAMRMGLVRIMTMGITGFDTPASAEGIKESLVAWEAISEYAHFYCAYADDSPLVSAIKLNFKEGAQSLRNAKGFDEFDRAAFIRNYLHPQYGLLLDLHQALGYETAAEVLNGGLAFNYSSKSVFSQDFFNLQYFTGLDPNAPEFSLQRRLGRKLFFDPILSQDLDRSCASCHKPGLAFSDGLAKSQARGGGFLARNTPGLYNTLYAEKFFYDLRADRMETQMEHVIFSPKEFASSYKIIFKRLKADEVYQNLFKQAFPTEGGGMSRYKLSRAIMAYLSELSSFDSKVDRYLRGEEVELSPEEYQGLNLFMGKAACATCHFAPTFSGLVPPFYEENESEVLGVFVAPGADSLDTDLGRYASGVVQDEAPFFKYSFKTPSIRNVAHTAPYFHNGAYPDLQSVLEFYNHGGALGAGIDLDNQTLPGDSLHLLPEEITAVEAFMRALSDTSTYHF